MIITTAGDSTGQLVTMAKKLAEKYQLTYKERNGVSIESMKRLYYDDVMVVGKDRIFIELKKGEERLFFHPNLAMVRAKRVLNHEDDPLIVAANLKEGMSFLDCTLGLASDSMIASLVVGETGTVTGIEGNPLLHLIVTEGLATLSSGNEKLDQAMRNIQTIYMDHFTYLQKAETNSYDVVYFDPMFQSTIEASSGIQSIRSQALTTDLTLEIIVEAKRVAKKRVILKDHWKSERFERFGFYQMKRKTSLFHYGLIEIEA